MLRLKSDVNLASELFEVIEIRKMYEKREKELRDHFKQALKDHEVSICEIGGFVMIVTERMTSIIDREKLVDVMGLDNAKRMEKIIQYQVLEVKKIA